MKMKNGEIVEHLNRLDAFQVREREFREQSGENLLRGRVKIGYAIEKNKYELRRQLEPYNKTLEALVKEYRDTEAEQDAIKAEQELAQKEGRAERGVSIIMREGMNREEYLRKLNELQELEIEVEGIHTVNISEFDGLNLDSAELRPFLFMLEE